MNEKHRSAVWMFALLALTCMIVTMNRRVFSVLSGAIRFELGLTATQIRQVADATPLGIALAGIGAGYLIGTIHRKTALMISLLLTSFATLAVAYTQGFASVFLARMMLGIGAGVHLVAILTIGTQYFPRHRSTIVAVVLFATGLGAVTGSSVGGLIEDAFGWHEAFITFGLMGLLLTALVAFFVKPRFTQAREITSFNLQYLQQQPEKSMWSRHSMLLGGMSLLLGVMIFSFRDLYVSHIRDEGGFTWQTGQVAFNLYAFGQLFAFYGASVFEKYGVRRVLVPLFSLLAVVSVIMLHDIWHGTMAYLFFSAMFGIALGGVATVILLSEMIRSVVSKEGPLITGFFYTCFFTPVLISGGVSESLQGSIGWGPSCLVLITGSLLSAVYLATRLPKRQEGRHKRRP